MCKVLGVSTNSHRRWKNQFVSETEKQRLLIKNEIIKIFSSVKKRYGAQRISVELMKRGYNISSSTVGRYMRSLGLYCEIRKTYR